MSKDKRIKDNEITDYIVRHINNRTDKMANHIESIIDLDSQQDILNDSVESARIIEEYLDEISDTNEFMILKLFDEIKQTMDKCFEDDKVKMSDRISLSDLLAVLKYREDARQKENEERKNMKGLWSDEH